MLLPDFKYHKNFNAMSSFTAIRHAPWNTFISSTAQMFSLVWYGYLTLFQYTYLE